MGLTARHNSHSTSAYSLPSSTSTSSLQQLSHQYAQSTPFPYVASTQTPQNTYHHNSAFQHRQNNIMPYTQVLQPVPAYLTPRGLSQTVGYVSPVSSSLQAHQAASTYSQMQPTSERLPNSQTVFSPHDSFSPGSQGVQAPPEPPQQTHTSQQAWSQPNFS